MTRSPLAPRKRQLAIPDGPALLTAYQEAQGRIFALEAENAALRQEIHWIDKLLAVPASVMSPSQKVTLRAAAKAIQRQAPDENSLVQIESWKLCKTVGQSKDTFLDNLTYLSEKAGVLRKQTQRIVTEDGNYTTNLYIGATDLVAHPERYRVEKPRNHGGERLLCPHCKSDRLQKKVTITCMGCGAVLDEHSSEVNKPEPGEQPGIPGTVIVQKRQVDGPALASFFASAQGNLTTEITTTKERQVDDPGREQGTPDGELREAPISPPSPTISDDPDAFLSTWLQKRQGPGQMIYATGRVETTRGKYLPLEQAPDLAAYLAGQKEHIYGSRLQLENGLTWVLCYDFDEKQPAYDRRAWVLLRKLARCGVCAVYWRRRPGRGHLEIYFDTPVDPRAARALLEQICPSLRQVAECYPVRNTALSWPLWQRIGDQVTECEMFVCYPWQADQVLSSPGIDRDRRGLALLLEYAITLASLIPPAAPERKAKAEDRDHAAGLGGLLEKSRDILPIVLNEFHAAHSWDEIANLCGGWDHGYFKAVWRGDRTASVKVDRDELYCCDYGNHGAFPKKLDKLGTWCLAQGFDQRAGLAKLCEEYQARFEASAFQPDSGNLKDVQMKPVSFSAKHEKISHEAPTNVSIQTEQLFPVEVPACNPENRPSNPPPARPSYCCGSLAWTWNEQARRYMCGSCKK